MYVKYNNKKRYIEQFMRHIVTGKQGLLRITLHLIQQNHMVPPLDIEDHLFSQIVSNLLTVLCC